MLNQVISQLQAASDPRAAKVIANKKFAVLGARGPDLLLYNPISPTLASNLVTLAQNPGPGQSARGLGDGPQSNAYLPSGPNMVMLGSLANSMRRVSFICSWSMTET